MTTSSFNPNGGDEDDVSEDGGQDDVHEQDEERVFTDIVDDDGTRKMRIIDTSRDDAVLESDYAVDLEVAR